MLGFQGGVSIPLVKGGGESPAREAPVSSRAEGMARLYFDGRAADGTTPAARFFGRTFPDLFETILSHIESLPRPRHRECINGLRS
jgi:hypothetical protein